MRSGISGLYDIFSFYKGIVSALWTLGKFRGICCEFNSCSALRANIDTFSGCIIGLDINHIVCLLSTDSDAGTPCRKDCTTPPIHGGSGGFLLEENDARLSDDIRDPEDPAEINGSGRI